MPGDGLLAIVVESFRDRLRSRNRAPVHEPEIGRFAFIPLLAEFPQVIFRMPADERIEVVEAIWIANNQHYSMDCNPEPRGGYDIAAIREQLRDQCGHRTRDE